MFSISISLTTAGPDPHPTILTIPGVVTIGPSSIRIKSTENVSRIQRPQLLSAQLVLAMTHGQTWMTQRQELFVTLVPEYCSGYMFVLGFGLQRVPTRA
jgi:hypothetical protein